MKLTDYYLMQEIRVVKSHRFDCTASTGGYQPFEAIANTSRDKRFHCYYGDVPDTFKAKAQRKADKALTNGDNISSVYIPDLDDYLFGYGDTAHTNDALLFVFSEDYKRLEIFVARGLKNNQRLLFDLLVDGELDDDIDCLRKQAKPTNAGTGTDK